VSRRTPNLFPAHGPDLRALLAACHAEYDDDTPRLVLADWLEEHDDPRGELVRLQCRLAALPAGDPEYDALFEQHQKWWKKYQNVWRREGANLVWNPGPHDRGLPTIGHYGLGYHDQEFYTSDLGEPKKNRLSALIEDGWPGMTWVFVDDALYEDADEIEALGFEPFDRPPWTGSPTPIGIYFLDDITITPGILNRIAKVPNIRGLALPEEEDNARLLPQIAKIKSLEHLDIGDIRLNDAGVRALAPLKRLRTLVVIASTVTNAGAATLAKFDALRELYLGSHRLRAAGYQALGRLAKLESLGLGEADDAALRHLSGLTRLRKLELSGTKVTGRGVKNFPLLTELDLSWTSTDDTSLAEVAQLPRLRRLDVARTSITGAALQHLRGLRWLEELNAAETALRNKDLVHLKPLKELRKVYLRETKVTRAGVAALPARLKARLDFGD
jgi:uncharacterized protein (TIGR02996 family)